MDLANQLEALAGAIRVTSRDLRAPEHRSAAYDVARAIEHLEYAVRQLRERETLDTAQAFGGGGR